MRVQNQHPPPLPLPNLFSLPASFLCASTTTAPTLSNTLCLGVPTSCTLMLSQEFAQPCITSMCSSHAACPCHPPVCRSNAPLGASLQIPSACHVLLPKCLFHVPCCVLLQSAPFMFSCLPCSWVRSVAVDPGNEWFATGSADRTIKIWDLASGQLKLTLTGHIEQVHLSTNHQVAVGLLHPGGEGGGGGRRHQKSSTWCSMHVAECTATVSRVTNPLK